MNFITFQLQSAIMMAQNDVATFGGIFSQQKVPLYYSWWCYSPISAENDSLRVCAGNFEFLSKQYLLCIMCRAIYTHRYDVKMVVSTAAKPVYIENSHNNSINFKFSLCPYQCLPSFRHLSPGTEIVITALKIMLSNNNNESFYHPNKYFGHIFEPSFYQYNTI